MADEKRPEIKREPEYTIKFIPPQGGDVKNIHLSAQALKIGAVSLAAGALLFVGAFSYAVYSTFAVRSGASEVRELREVNKIQQEQLLNLSKKANALQEQMDQLRQIENDLRRMSGAAPAKDSDAQAPSSPAADGNGGDGTHDGQGGPIVQPDFNNVGQVLDLVEQGLAVRRQSLLELKQQLQARQDMMGTSSLNDLGMPGGTVPAIWPARGDVSSPYGLRWNGSDFHPGIDIANDMGTPIVATADGIVTTAGWNSGGYGNMVDIDHGNGIMTRYGHAMQVAVVAGQHVRRGQVIAYMGSTGFSTGPHVHYEVRINGTPVNPSTYLH
ncbi:M23 family metallopeptidase [Selenomonas caprae]|uniref:M23 family metallopeptidase n=1 Tax=Selenomonas caprae TaxID=2606905 RepID=UPI001562FD9B|nr:M23 family metallopeptidase [Selenomonas caprae]MBQ1890611.1 M23 family metallopeptidase [Selenomonas sp.]